MTPRIYTDRYYRRLTQCGAWVYSVAALVLYLLTAEPTVSFWDCPEYVANAARLEPGHPPGNPLWMLTAHFFTLFAPPEQQAYMVNAMSGVCSAAAVFFLFLTLRLLIDRLFFPSTHEVTRRRMIIALSGASIGATMLAVSDTFWFSATEAEVYAFSAMLTSLTVWLVLFWGEQRRSSHASRYLVLIAWIAGLSIGVHQLNLLVLPVVALAVVFYSFADLPRRIVAAALLFSMLAIVCVLFDMMPGVLALACEAELMCVNTLGWPLHSGVLIYVALTIIALISACVLTQSDSHRTLSLTILMAAIWLTGLFSPGGRTLIGVVICAAMALLLILMRKRLPMTWVNIMTWCVTMLFAGFCSYAVIMIRGVASPPMNQGATSDIFAFRSYLNREQYGGAPLLYGQTPYSTPLYEEEMSTDSITGQRHAAYRTFARVDKAPDYRAVADSKGHYRYEQVPSRRDPIYTPELNMWFPRIYSSDPLDRDSYEGWTGMNDSNMQRVEVSYAIDSAGHPVGRYDSATGERRKSTALRPTYLQQFKMLAGYQVSYMYTRYLLWNFLGRQNDVYAQGEPDAGNFITGIPVADALMTGDSAAIPPDIGASNAGHHNYLWLPMLLAIAGIAAQLGCGRRGRRQFALVGMLFILTGVAIVLYLNQTPGQPRERDYSFVGSFYAWCIWIGVGASWTVAHAIVWWRRHTRSRLPNRIAAVAVVSLCVVSPLIMLWQNLPDHNRAGRRLTRQYAAATLAPLPQDAIIFVNGDNYTFPLWYIREVEHLRPDVRTVNLAYLSSGWYPRQLATQDYTAAPIALSLPADSLNPATLARYAVVDIGYGTRDAAQALRELFLSPSTATRPRINADSLRFALPGADSVTISLRDIAAPHTYLRADKIFTLDILACNLKHRPVMFHSALLPGNMAGFFPHSTTIGMAVMPGLYPDSLQRNVHVIMNYCNDMGVAGAHYIDMPGRRQVSQTRRFFIQTASRLLDRADEGDVLRAVAIADLAQRELPGTLVPYGTYTFRGKPYSEAVDLARIYLRAWRLTGHDDYRRIALQLADDELTRNLQYRRYMESLPAAYRTYTKSSTRLSSQLLYGPIRVMLDAGADSLALMRKLHSLRIDPVREDTLYRNLTR